MEPFLSKVHRPIYPNTINPLKFRIKIPKVSKEPHSRMFRNRFFFCERHKKWPIQNHKFCRFHFKLQYFKAWHLCALFPFHACKLWLWQYVLVLLRLPLLLTCDSFLIRGKVYQSSYTKAPNRWSLYRRRIHTVREYSSGDINFVALFTLSTVQSLNFAL